MSEQNPYVAEETSEKQGKNGIELIDLAAAAFAILYFSIPLSLICFVATCVRNYVVYPEPRFRVNEEVVVTDGFCRGYSGRIRSATRHFDMSWRYLVRLEPYDIEWVNEDDMEFR